MTGFNRLFAIRKLCYNPEALLQSGLQAFLC